MTDAQDTGTGVRLIRGATAGLIAGMLASFAMDRFQAAVSTVQGSDSDGEPATAKAANRVKTVIGGSPVSEPQQALAGQLVHYTLGSVLGVAYGIAAEFRPAITIGYGTAFGLGVAAVLDEATVPALGLGSPPTQTPLSEHLYSGVSHLVFGATAEFTRRTVRSTLLPPS